MYTPSPITLIQRCAHREHKHTYRHTHTYIHAFTHARHTHKHTCKSVVLPLPLRPMMRPKLFGGTSIEMSWIQGRASTLSSSQVACQRLVSIAVHRKHFELLLCYFWNPPSDDLTVKQEAVISFLWYLIIKLYGSWLLGYASILFLSAAVATETRMSGHAPQPSVHVLWTLQLLKHLIIRTDH